VLPPQGAVIRKWIAACALVLLAAAACTPKERPYPEEIAARRAAIDEFMRESPQSPIPAARRSTFPPLTYYPIEPEYRVPAELSVARGSDVLEIPTSTGQRRRMRRIGTLKFTLKDQPLTLTAFMEADSRDMQRLFVPFGDLTNGNETYPGGRYLDLDRTATGIYDLDFNRAYHPYCVFNPEYDCPYPPRENRLKVPIRAGEKLGPSAQPQS
jgi:uncharacterized protein (DUF1684 family)